MRIIMNKNVVLALMLIVLVSSLALGQGGAPAGQQPPTTRAQSSKGKRPLTRKS